VRIAIINQYYKPDLSPVSHLVASLAEHLAANGHDVTVLTSKAVYAGDPNAPLPEMPANLRIWRAPAPRFAATSIARRAFQYLWFYMVVGLKMLMLRRQDVIITTTTPPYVGLLGVLHKWLHWRSRLVLWNMDCYPDILAATNLIKRGGIMWRVTHFAQRWLFKRLDHVVCLDEPTRELLESQYAPRRRKLPFTVLPNFERRDMFEQHAAQQPWPGYAELGLTGRFVVLYLGNAGYGHRFDAVIDAAQRLRDEPVTFLFIGGGSARKGIDAEAKKQSLTNILLRDYVPKELTPSVMAGAQLGLISLDDSALGMMSPSKLHAKLAMGLPVLYVGPPRSNVDHAIATFNCGLSFRHDQGEAMAAAIRRLMADESAVREMRANARAAFEQAYSDAAVLPQFEAVLMSVVK
jgi:glycosyltransferase involved in cell wall biosynthesis